MSSTPDRIVHEIDRLDDLIAEQAAEVMRLELEGFPARAARAKLTVMRQRFQVLRAWHDQASSPKRCIVLLG